MSKPLQVDNSLSHLFTNNRQWAQKTTQNEPSFFSKLAEQQSPEYLWIGCADSRVPANELIGLQPGEVFVHRNIANIIVPSDLNCLSVLQYAVDVLKVKHVIICGHYGCGGVAAAFHNRRVGLVDNWLRHIHDTKAKYHALLSTTDEKANLDRLCELNVIDQVFSAAQTTIIQDAWQRGQSVTIHGWVYDLHDGLLHSLGLEVSSLDHLQQQSQTVFQRMAQS
ncbi:MAG: carbonate dehydratase [Burkholderiaceae bacterium]|jgi:carbonic anhydrase